MHTAVFHSLSTAEIASIVQAHDISTCSFAFNGTRRWFQLEAADHGDDLERYVMVFTQRVLDICELLFEHGLTTIILPVISPHVWESRSKSYQKIAQDSLVRLFCDPRFLNFYEEHEVSAYLFGDFANHLPSQTTQSLMHHYSTYRQDRQPDAPRRIFWGICAHDTTHALTQASIDFYKAYQQTPTKSELVNYYYGDAIHQIDFHVGSGKPKIFDIPLLWTGQESLYFTATPSPYFDQRQLRFILYDHIFARKVKTSYNDITSAQQHTLRNHYRLNKDQILGVGDHRNHWGIWHASLDAISDGRNEGHSITRLAAHHMLEEG